jgi:hypothetical protein
MDKAARVHSNRSNRAGTGATGNSHMVYKGVLDNPFTVKWSVPIRARLARIHVCAY